MAWVILVIAGLFEIGWAIGLKYAEGFTRLWPSIWTVLAMSSVLVAWHSHEGASGRYCI